MTALISDCIIPTLIGDMYIYSDCEEQSPSPTPIGPPLNIKDVKHCAELRKADREQYSHGGDPLVQKRIREVRICRNDRDMVSESIASCECV